MKIEWQWSGYRFSLTSAILIAGYGLGQFGLWWAVMMLAIFCGMRIEIDK
ncbi:hypothetical protein [Klebsiella michiganensis]|nr:hypothetical protein [Klebsiella michiganensis]